MIVKIVYELQHGYDARVLIGVGGIPIACVLVSEAKIRGL